MSGAVFCCGGRFFGESMVSGVRCGAGVFSSGVCGGWCSGGVPVAVIVAVVVTVGSGVVVVSGLVAVSVVLVVGVSVVVVFVVVDRVVGVRGGG